MKVIINNISDNWQDIKDAAMTTINKNSGAYPTSEWKRKLLLSEHSPIRLLKIQWTWQDLPYFVSVHFVRHKIGIEHFVSTQRTDRTKIDRAQLKQNALVNHKCEANAQAIINISRKRLCGCASKETQSAWLCFLDKIKELEPELYSVCEPECVYRNGLCPEIFGCGYNKTELFKNKLEEYLK